MPAMRRARQLSILLLVTALVAGASGPAAGARAQNAGPARATRVAQQRPVAVTLLTGDKVLLRRQPGGRQAVQVLPRRGASPAFQVVSVRGDLHVIPADVRHLVGGLLDLDLFNVSALERMGYGDARAPSLPLIVQRRTAGRPPAWPRPPCGRSAS
jgi:hypothetical protein